MSIVQGPRGPDSIGSAHWVVFCWLILYSAEMGVNLWRADEGADASCVVRDANCLFLAERVSRHQWRVHPHKSSSHLKQL